MQEYRGFLVDDNLSVYDAKSGKRLSIMTGTDGYLKVRRYINRKKYKEIRLHVLYANCFIPNPKGYRYINHKDSNKANCSLDNLEWCTASYNTIHNFNSGTRLPRNVKIEVEDIDKKNKWTFPSIQKCSKELHLDAHKVARVLKGDLRPDYLGYRFTFATT